MLVDVIASQSSWQRKYSSTWRRRRWCDVVNTAFRWPTQTDTQIAGSPDLIAAVSKAEQGQLRCLNNSERSQERVRSITT